MKANAEYILEMFKGLNPDNKDEAIQAFMDKFSFQKNTARSYFYQWKKVLKEMPEKEEPVDYDARIKEYAESQKQDDTPCDPMNAPKWLRDKMCDLVPVKIPEKELPKVEVIADPDAIIEAARAMHEVNTEPIKEFTEEEKAEVEVIEAEMTKEPFEMSMELKGKIFTYQLNDKGVNIIDGYVDTIAIESINEQQKALDAWNKHFGRDGLSTRLF